MHRPAVERSDSAGFPRPELVTLAEHGGVIAVEPQGLGQHRDVAGTHPGVPREGGGHFRDDAKVGAVTIATGQQGHARGRTQGGNLEIVVAQPGRGEAVQRRHLDGPAERRSVAEAKVVEKDDHHVGRAFRRLHLEPRRSSGIARIKLGNRRIFRLGDRQHGTIQRNCSRGGAAGGLRSLRLGGI